MRTFILPFIAVMLLQHLAAQTSNPNYNDSLAKKFGADAYGMKSYYFVLLTSGENKTTDKAVIDSCFRSHMNNINHLVELKKLIVAGPFGKNEFDYRGLFILEAKDEHEVKALLSNDAAISHDILSAKIIPWYGSAALPAYLEVSDQIWSKEP